MTVTVVRPFSDVADPVVTAQRGEGLRDGFVKGFGRHVDRVRGLVQIVDNDGTGSESHNGDLSFSLFLRQLVDTEQIDEFESKKRMVCETCPG